MVFDDREKEVFRSRLCFSFKAPLPFGESASFGGFRWFLLRARAREKGGESLCERKKKQEKNEVF
jgi:hypothetical protein